MLNPTGTGTDMERNNYSLIIREVRRWLAQKATELPSPGRVIAWQAQWSNGGSWKDTGAPQRTEDEAWTLLENSKVMTKRVVPLVTLIPGPTALEKYRELEVDKNNLSPLENLRVFCSLAMRGQDWLDVERFFTALEPMGATDD